MLHGHHGLALLVCPAVLEVVCLHQDAEVHQGPAAHSPSTDVPGIQDLQPLLCTAASPQVLAVLHGVVAPVMVQGPRGLHGEQLPEDIGESQGGPGAACPGPFHSA